MGYVPLPAPPGPVAPPPRFPSGRPHAQKAMHCHSCGAPLHSSEHRCAWCLTPNPNWRWIGEGVEITTLQDAQRVFVSEEPISDDQAQAMRLQWQALHSKPAAYIEHPDPPLSRIDSRLSIWPLIVLTCAGAAAVIPFLNLMIR